MVLSLEIGLFHKPESFLLTCFAINIIFTLFFKHKNPPCTMYIIKLVLFIHQLFRSLNAIVHNFEVYPVHDPYIECTKKITRNSTVILTNRITESHNKTHLA